MRVDMHDPECPEIRDERKLSDLIFADGKISVCYTLKTDDITKGEKPGGTPYIDRTGEFTFDGSLFCGDGGLFHAESNTRLKIGRYKNGLLFTAERDGESLSEWGLNFPFNFMGKLGGGEFTDQFLLNSPYITPERDFMSFFLSKPNGNHLLLAVKSGGAGWKMDYSPYLGGHFQINLKIFGSFDRAYDRGEGNKKLEIVLLPVSDYFEALTELAALHGRPFLYPLLSNGKIGEKTNLLLFGEADKIVEEHDGIARETGRDYTFSHEGESRLTPYYRGEKGATVTVYGYSSLVDLYKKSMDSVDLSVVAETDGNLCEHQCWASAILRFLINYKEKLTPDEVKIYEKKALTLLDVITEKDPAKAVARRTILQTEYDGYPAYHIFRSRRIQEQFFGITILLDAYKYFRKEEYLRYAIGATDCLIDFYQAEDGRLETSNCGEKEDYTTVCCAMIPLADMANFLKESDPSRSERYAASARKMAEYLFARGLEFPTEGGVCEHKEMEDGSISCTALSLLYYCKNLAKEERFIQKAKEILDLHESWVMKTPVCQMQGSSLRWWETQWEGDKDGPAFCCGHAWTIWRAEADYLYYALTGDETYLVKAKNGFGTNFSKIRADGTSYSIYNVDDINGGGFHSRSEEIEFKIADKFASVPDCGISRYVWIRANDSLLNEEGKNGD